MTNAPVQEEAVISNQRKLSTLNPEQSKAAYQPTDQAVQVVAGAGTGKTELIAHRFLHLVKNFQEQGIHNSQNRIAVVTFTNEASLSMRARIDRALKNTMDVSLDAQCWISNFHQLANRILRQHALFLNLSPTFEILDSLNQRLLFERTVEGILNGEYDILRFKENLSKIFKQYGLVSLSAGIFSQSHLKQHLGSASITDILDAPLLMSVIQKAKASGLSPAEFHRASLEQLKQFSKTLQTLPVSEIADNVERNAKGQPLPLSLMLSYLIAWRKHLAPWADTSWNPIQEVEKACLEEGIEPTATLYKEAVSDLVSVLCQFDRSAKAYVPKSSLEEYLNRIKEQEPILYCLVDIVSAVYALYQHHLRVKNVCDFDDLINHCLTLFESYPELASDYQRLFLHVIVDEFQDSNTSQLRLLRYLTQPEQRNLTVVGDQKQSIYSFRFAQPDNLHLVFENPDVCQQIPLHTNYRSYPPILAVANTLSDRIVKNASQRLYACERYENETKIPVTWCTLGIPEITADSKGNTKYKEEALSSQQEREAEWIASEIQQLVQKSVQNSSLENQSGESTTSTKFQFNDIAILVKSHQKAELIQQALNQKNIPSVRKKNLGFFEDSAIKTALSLLQLMVNVHDDCALVRVLQMKLNHHELYLLAQARQSLKEAIQASRIKENTATDSRQPFVSLFDVIARLELDASLAPTLLPSTRQALVGLGQSIVKLKKRQHYLSPSQLLQALANEVGLIQPETPSHLKHQQRINIRTLDKWLTQIASQHQIQPSLREIVETIFHYRNDPNLELPISNFIEVENAVQIMTVHASKGLEFKTVFVAWCERPKPLPQTGFIAFDPQNAAKAGFGLFTCKTIQTAKNKKEQAQKEHTTLQKIVYQTIWQRPQVDEEEQRLFYVALTRAKEKLYVLHSRQSPAWTKPPKLEQRDWLEHWIEADHQ